MTINNPAQKQLFHDDYEILAEYVTDDSFIPYYNPEDSGQLVQPGEPLVVQFGPAGEARVYMAQGPIRPGFVGMLTKYFTGDFPCDLSADAVIGQEIAWDTDDAKAKLAGDVTNGFILGDLSYHLTSHSTARRPTVNGDGRVIAATANSNKCRVISRNEAAQIIGAVTVLGAVEAPASETED